MDSRVARTMPCHCGLCAGSGACRWPCGAAPPGRDGVPSAGWFVEPADRCNVEMLKKEHPRWQEFGDVTGGDAGGDIADGQPVPNRGGYFLFVAAGCFVLAGIWRLVDCRHFGSEEMCVRMLMEGLIPAVIFAVVWSLRLSRAKKQITTAITNVTSTNNQ